MTLGMRGGATHAWRKPVFGSVLISASTAAIRQIPVVCDRGGRGWYWSRSYSVLIPRFPPYVYIFRRVTAIPLFLLKAL